ncbi:hypothetical protein [Albibacterium bauzanense]|uniref:Uncharacterized protein n=1 Tax=Albibacterium bauzanense TaxID=653929 RepID=A0A4R1M789_9SPHI|nr:hypothetical protein [Albibacterium bauzanense]TCK85553.1 hypothetical protein C8N28_0864 [Albibacterium bauzanense]
MDRFEIARIKYKPDIIKVLLIAEAPPKSDSDRFFYFENVPEQDSLFLETMKVLYPIEISQLTTKEIRSNKRKFLLNFKQSGFYLIDSLERPFDVKYSSNQKVRLIERDQPNLLSKINSIIDENTKVILISATVFKADFQYLKQNNINVINKELIDFPGSGNQIKFREKMNIILTDYNIV